MTDPLFRSCAVSVLERFDSTDLFILVPSINVT